MKTGKTAFVASGGGLMCAYGAGVAWALQDKGIKADIFIGFSGSAGTVSYSACGEAERAAELWKEEVTNPRVSQKNPLKLDVDFVIDTMRDHFPFNENKLRSPATDLYLAATEHRTVQTRFFSNHEAVDWHEVMRASMAIPFVYGRKIEIDGRRYIDGGIATTLKDCIEFAIQKGASTVYACDCDMGTESYLRNAQVLGIRPLLSQDFLKACVGLIKRQFASVKEHKDVEIIYLKPLSYPEEISIWDNSKATIGALVQQGCAETMMSFEGK